ncbi:hypothetical protein VKT23_010898 [Stygiomarasmius scandens]|uniref:Uncharacterized protein n=1 Tax=Marasmiellus scandens TaxID=2682957 RepID=A0ABR1JBE1_9AGAR
MGKKKSSANTPTNNGPFTLLTNDEFIQQATRISRNTPLADHFVGAVKAFIRNGSTPHALSAFWTAALSLTDLGSSLVIKEQEVYEHGLEEGQRVALIEAEEKRKLEVEQTKATTVEEVLTAIFGSGPILLPEDATASAWVLSKRFHRPVGYSDAERAMETVREQIEEEQKEMVERAQNMGYEEGRKSCLGEVEKRCAEAYSDGHRDGWKNGKGSGEVKEREAWESSGHVQVGKCSAGHQPKAPCLSTGISTDDNLPIRLFTHSATQTIPTPESKFDWFEDSDATFPAASINSPSPRDISVLRSSSSHPFGSLQRRIRRSQPRAHAPFFSNSTPRYPVFTRQHPFRIGPRKPVYTHPRPTRHTEDIDWIGDPRLKELSRILGELGWVRRS